MTARPAGADTFGLHALRWFRSGSGPIAELQRIGADEPGEAFAENGPLDHGEGLEPPNQRQCQGVKAMRFTGVIRDKRIVKIMTDDVGQAHDGIVEGFVRIGRGQRTMMKVSRA